MSDDPKDDASSEDEDFVFRGPQAPPNTGPAEGSPGFLDLDEAALELDLPPGQLSGGRMIAPPEQSAPPVPAYGIPPQVQVIRGTPSAPARAASAGARPASSPRAAPLAPDLPGSYGSIRGIPKGADLQGPPGAGPRGAPPGAGARGAPQVADNPFGAGGAGPARGAPMGATGHAPFGASPGAGSRRRGSFGANIGTALVVPFLGAGVLWLPLIAVALIASLLFGFILKIVAMATMMALIAGYFAKSFQRGYDGEAVAPELPNIANFKDELLYPGLALIALSIALFALPAWQTVRVVAAAAGDVMEQLEEGQRGRPEQRAEALNPNEVFLDPQGKIVTPKEGDEGRLVKRADGNWVRIYYDDGYIVYENNNDPSAAQPAEAPEPAIRTPKIPTGSIVLLVLAFLIPFVYWPMALAVGTTGDNLMAVFNPVEVFGAIARAGSKYIVVVLMGVVLPAIPIVLMTRSSIEGALGLAAIMLGIMGYTAAVQGYLMGCIAAEEPELFPKLGQ